MPLGNSQRCLAPIVSAAVHVKESADQFSPAPGNGGHALLVRYIDMVPDVSRLSRALQAARALDDIKIIVRGNVTLSKLTSGKADEIHSLHCPALTHMGRAVQAFRQGRNAAALAIARASLELAVFGHEGAVDAELQEHEIDPREWKAFAVRCLLQCNAVDSSTSMQDWQVTIGRIMDQRIQDFGLPASVVYVAGKLKPKNLRDNNRRKAGADKPYSVFAPRSDVAVDVGKTVQTVHGVKGETHDVTIFVCPDSKAGHCPSTIWWSDGEERRIAYVAMTRTRGDLILCVSEPCYQRLCEHRPEFVSAFECKTLDDYIAAL